MPCTPVFPTRLEGKEMVVAGAGHSSAVPPYSSQLVCPPETLYYEVASRAKTTPRPVPPVMSLGPSPSQVGARAGMWRTEGTVGHLGNPCQLSAIALCRRWRLLRSRATAESRGAQHGTRAAA